MSNAGSNAPSGSPVYIALIILIYWGGHVVISVLLVRFGYNLVLLLRHGRKEGVKVVSIHTLFNPLNFLLFPSLLNDQGLDYRRRCIISVVLMVFFIGLLFYVAKFS